MTEGRTFVSRTVWLAILILILLATSAGALDGPLSRTFALTDPQIEPAGDSLGDSLKVIVPGIADGGRSGTKAEAGDRVDRSPKIIGVSLFSSGLFLCSWGITSWQFEDDQCCPARNTENVLKIIVGVVLVNAGLVYLLGGAD